MAIYSGFVHWKLWLSIHMLVYQKVNPTTNPTKPSLSYGFSHGFPSFCRFGIPFLAPVAGWWYSTCRLRYLLRHSVFRSVYQPTRSVPTLVVGLRRTMSQNNWTSPVLERSAVAAASRSLSHASIMKIPCGSCNSQYCVWISSSNRGQLTTLVRVETHQIWSIQQIKQIQWLQTKTDNWWQIKKTLLEVNPTKAVHWISIVSSASLSGCIWNVYST